MCAYFDAKTSSAVRGYSYRLTTTSRGVLATASHRPCCRRMICGLGLAQTAAAIAIAATTVANSDCCESLRKVGALSAQKAAYESLASAGGSERASCTFLHVCWRC